MSPDFGGFRILTALLSQSLRLFSQYFGSAASAVVVVGLGAGPSLGGVSLTGLGGVLGCSGLPP